MRGVVLFYVNIKNLSVLNDISFYEQDIRVLKEMGFSVILSNKYSDVFLKKYDYIYIWWWSYALIPLLWSKLKFKKSIVTGAFHYNTPLVNSDFKSKGLIYKILVKFALKFADANIFVSNIEYKDVTKNLNVNNPFMVYHGIDTDKYYSKNTSPAIEPKTKKILMISWLEKNNIERKCIKQSIEAVCKLYSSGYSVNLSVAGRPGPGYDDFISYVNSLNGIECVKFLGHISETKKIHLLQNTDIFLSPTLYEGFGVAIAEALSCGCAVITSNNGAVPEVAGQCALYCEPQSVQSIYNNLKMLLDNPDEIQKFSECASKRIKRKFSYLHHCEKLSSIIDKVFKEKFFKS